MTDMEKAKQCAAWILANCSARYISPVGFADAPQVVIDKMIEAAAEKIVAFASHSNSELLERVQKLEQALTEIRDHSLTFDVDEIRYIAIEGLAKAPETRNV